MATRVMLVDDAVVVRHVLTDALGKDPDLEVVGSAADGRIAMEKLPALKPDVVVLDVEMPNMDGIETLAAIKKLYPRIKVIMFSTLTSRGAAATMDALMLGADDYVCKPANVSSIGDAMGRINAELVPRIKALHRSNQSIAAPAVPVNPAAPGSAATRFASPTAPVAPAAPASPAAPATPGAPSAAVSPGIAPRPAATPLRSASPLASTGTPLVTSTPGAARTPTPFVSGAGGRPQILAIAVSTGGPNALASLLPQLPADLAVPIVIVQHIPPMFSKALADRLDTKCNLHVAECEPGAVLQPGDVWVAPGDFHMVVQREGTTVRLATNQAPPENSCRPAADVLFRSVAATYGANALGLVLTGMGNDGLKGSQDLVRAGAKVIAQDEASSVVWGMPGAVVAAGVTERVLPLAQLAAEIVQRVGTARTAAAIPSNRS